jgi:hypothetical protein
MSLNLEAGRNYPRQIADRRKRMELGDHPLSSGARANARRNGFTDSTICDRGEYLHAQRRHHYGGAHNDERAFVWRSPRR